MLCVLIAAI